MRHLFLVGILIITTFQSKAQSLYADAITYLDGPYWTVDPRVQHFTAGVAEGIVLGAPGSTNPKFLQLDENTVMVLKMEDTCYTDFDKTADLIIYSVDDIKSSAAKFEVSLDGQTYFEITESINDPGRKCPEDLNLPCLFDDVTGVEDDTYMLEIDLDLLGIEAFQYVRITDYAREIDGQYLLPELGFDLDAVEGLHSTPTIRNVNDNFLYIDTVLSLVGTYWSVDPREEHSTTEVAQIRVTGAPFSTDPSFIQMGENSVLTMKMEDTCFTDQSANADIIIYTVDNISPNTASFEVSIDGVNYIELSSSLNVPSSPCPGTTERTCLSDGYLMLDNTGYGVEVDLDEIGIESFQYVRISSFSENTSLQDELVKPETESSIDELGFDLESIAGPHSESMLVTSSNKGQEAISRADAVNLFPNPANGTVTLESNEIGINRIEIINSDGIIVNTIIEHYKSFNVSNLFSGKYLVRIYSEDGAILTKPLIIE
jgi:hypothetical protein